MKNNSFNIVRIVGQVIFKPVKSQGWQSENFTPMSNEFMSYYSFWIPLHLFTTKLISSIIKFAYVAVIRFKKVLILFFMPVTFNPVRMMSRNRVCILAWYCSVRCLPVFLYIVSFIHFTIYYCSRRTIKLSGCYCHSVENPFVSGVDFIYDPA